MPVLYRLSHSIVVRSLAEKVDEFETLRLFRFVTNHPTYLVDGKHGPGYDFSFSQPFLINGSRITDIIFTICHDQFFTHPFTLVHFPSPVVTNIRIHPVFIRLAP